jgi:hypothetical protein
MIGPSGGPIPGCDRRAPPPRSPSRQPSSSHLLCSRGRGPRGRERRGTFRCELQCVALALALRCAALRCAALRCAQCAALRCVSLCNPVLSLLCCAAHHRVVVQRNALLCSAPGYTARRVTPSDSASYTAREQCIEDGPVRVRRFRAVFCSGTPAARCLTALPVPPWGCARGL